ncbi:NUDIX domain-containing protein [Indiicoccus explosivorum]|uniref:NUDIX domain-containing protein n=1 Tax=Indiicoccus explosivorum TaxID=1917864 RepID=UPI001F4E8805|nr:NUDIX hydrolase [Indiicoccus explosivorum]
MAENKRGNVWLGVAGLAVDENGRWLVVKKRYSGLKGKWSLPAGFVKHNETVDSAVLREVREETGLECAVTGMIGFRSGVIRGEISDNMAVFSLRPIRAAQTLRAQAKEIAEAKWLTPREIVEDPDASVMLTEMAGYELGSGYPIIEGKDPGEVFGYSAYKLFFKTI